MSDVTLEGIERCTSDDGWIFTDKWLARLVGGGRDCPALVVLVIPTQGELPSLGGVLSECISRGAGVEVAIEPVEPMIRRKHVNIGV